MDSRLAITDQNRKWWTLGAMCLSMFRIMLDSTVVNVALPSRSIPRCWRRVGAQANKFTDALGAAMAMGAALTAVGAVVAAVVIRGKPKHELSARGGPELPPPSAL
ncbi:MAG: hypothetical protein ACXWMG_03545 [Candidatus Limnocylindria bacterium]